MAPRGLAVTLLCGLLLAVVLNVSAVDIHRQAAHQSALQEKDVAASPPSQAPLPNPPAPAPDTYMSIPSLPTYYWTTNNTRPYMCSSMGISVTPGLWNPDLTCAQAYSWNETVYEPQFTTLNCSSGHIVCFLYATLGLAGGSCGSGQPFSDDPSDDWEYMPTALGEKMIGQHSYELTFGDGNVDGYPVTHYGKWKVLALCSEPSHQLYYWWYKINGLSNVQSAAKVSSTTSSKAKTNSKLSALKEAAKEAAEMSNKEAHVEKKKKAKVEAHTSTEAATQVEVKAEAGVAAAAAALAQAQEQLREAAAAAADAEVEARVAQDTDYDFPLFASGPGAFTVAADGTSTWHMPVFRWNTSNPYSYMCSSMGIDIQSNVYNPDITCAQTASGEMSSTEPQFLTLNCSHSRIKCFLYATIGKTGGACGSGEKFYDDGEAFQHMYMPEAMGLEILGRHTYTLDWGDKEVNGFVIPFDTGKFKVIALCDGPSDQLYYWHLHLRPTYSSSTGTSSSSSTTGTDPNGAIGEVTVVT